MGESERIDPHNDPFRPPTIPTEVRCLKCGHEYESYLMYWEERIVAGQTQTLWYCPTRKCGGAGFGFDIFPTDPEYINEGGESMFIWDEEQPPDDTDRCFAGEDDHATEWDILDDPADADLEDPPTETYRTERTDDNEQWWDK